MHKIPVDIAVIGGGPAGLAAAVKAKEEGFEHLAGLFEKIAEKD